MEIVYNIFTFLAGLGVLLLSVNLLGKSMQSLVGAKLRNAFANISGKVTSFSMGAIGTLLLQSSTALSVMVISFVQAGIVTFAQSVIIIMGVNLGAPFVLITLIFGSFKLSVFLSGLAGIGALIVTLVRNEKVKLIGKIMLGLGLLFLGINVMSQSMEFFRTLPAFTDAIGMVTNPFILILLGVVFTSIIQSSMATDAVLITLCGTSVALGSLTVQAALWISLGAKVGTTLTGYIAMIGMRPVARKVAFTHTAFNLTSVILMGLLFLTGWTYWLEALLVEPVFVIVAYNIVAGILTFLLWLPITKWITKFIDGLVVDKRNELDIFEMDSRIFEMPSLAISQITKQIEFLFNQYTGIVKNTYKLITHYDVSSVNEIALAITKFDQLCDTVTNSLIKVESKVIQSETIRIVHYHNIISHYESLSHRAGKVLGHLQATGGKFDFTEKKLNALNKLFKQIMLISELVEKVLVHYNNNVTIEPELMSKLIELDNSITKIKIKLKKEILCECIDAKKKSQSVDRYARIINEFEQIGEHFTNIALGIV